MHQFIICILSIGLIVVSAFLVNYSNRILAIYNKNPTACDESKEKFENFRRIAQAALITGLILGIMSILDTEWGSKFEKLFLNTPHMGFSV